MPDDPIDRPDDLTELEARLAAWRPAAAGLDRGRMLYEAGRAAALAERRAASRAVAAAAILLALSTVGLGVGWGLERRRDAAREARWLAATRPDAGRSATAIVVGPTPPAPTAIADGRGRRPESGGYLGLTRRIAEGRFDREVRASGPGPTRPGQPAPVRAGDRNRFLSL